VFPYKIAVQIIFSAVVLFLLHRGLLDSGGYILIIGIVPGVNLF